MALVSDDALTLTVSDYSETSQIVTFFTRHNGKVRLIAKGSKRPKSSFGGTIDRLQLVQAVFSVRRRETLGQLTELSISETLPGLRTSLKAFYGAATLGEILAGATEELDPHEELFKIAAQTLRRLSCGDDSAILIYRFQAQALRILGLMPELQFCVACRRKRPGGRSGVFNALAGGLLCRRCLTEQGEQMSVSGKALDALGFLATADDRQTERVRLSVRTAADIRKLLCDYWQHVLGRPLRSMRWAP
ncbi:MAG: DNA repair protein RecO [Anaerolineaceae bacterium]|nr:DNA repair protein RecO [Anaerolineaceae bacterium]